MQSFSARITVTLLTFLLGVAAVTIWLSARRDSSRNQSPLAIEVPGAPNKAQDAPMPSKPCSLSPSRKRIDAAEAVRLAECFVIGNGYTALPPMEDKSKLSYESWDDGPPADEALERRHDTVESKAYGVMKGGRAKDGWAVVFRYNLRHEELSRFRPEFQEHLKGVGRGVTMDAHGGKMRVEHEDFDLSKCERVGDVSP